MGAARVCCSTTTHRAKARRTARGHVMENKGNTDADGDALKKMWKPCMLTKDADAC
jgi:hypothetical protein